MGVDASNAVDTNRGSLRLRVDENTRKLNRVPKKSKLSEGEGWLFLLLPRSSWQVSINFSGFEFEG